jgi:GIY-YIG catalytic domain-containing protein
MVKLFDLLRASGVIVQESDCKIHCAPISTSALEEFFAGLFESTQREQNQRNFQRPHVLALIQLPESRSHWLFAGIYDVHEVAPDLERGHGFLYDTTERADARPLVGRVIVDFKKGRASYLRGENCAGDLQVLEVRRERLATADFPGFKSVRLPLPSLRTLMRQAIPSWRTPLMSVSGVYVIADSTSGKLYVGSAVGEGGLWSRWAAYCKNGHGGNKELRALLKKKGSQHSDKFVISVLEVCDPNATQEEILGRESHWKDVLLTRRFGLNAN